MRFAQPGLSEADLQVHFEYVCARGGAQCPAYVRFSYPSYLLGCVLNGL